jgi:DNA modification methylase
MNFKNMLLFIGIERKKIMEDLGQGLDHCFRFENRTFYIPTEKNYSALINKYKIDEMQNFIPYNQLKRQWDEENKTVFNLPKNQKIYKNVLGFSKDSKNIHPTQKPLDLLINLINVFTNETIK